MGSEKINTARRVDLGDGSSFPSHETDVGWQARYGTPDPLALASYVDAYRALVIATRKRREQVVRALRADASRASGSGR